MKRVITYLAGLGLLSTMAFAGPLGAKPGNKYPNEVARPTHQCTDAPGTIDFTGPEKMWPPNHKYQPITTIATATDPSDMVTLEVVGTHDEIIDGEEMEGAGNTEMDVNPNPGEDSGTGSATVRQEVRSERSGQGDGRVYTISVFATFDGQPCEVEMNEENEPVEVSVDYTMTVPHDMRGGANWK